MYLPFAVYRGKLTISLTADLMIRKGGTKVAITAVNSKLPSAVGNPSPIHLAQTFLPISAKPDYPELLVNLNEIIT